MRIGIKPEHFHHLHGYRVALNDHDFRLDAAVDIGRSGPVFVVIEPEAGGPGWINL
jgi:hypothetical protein